jgi:hypothetical protein
MIHPELENESPGKAKKSIFSRISDIYQRKY